MGAVMTSTWPCTRLLVDLARGPIQIELAPDEATRAEIARTVTLEALPRLTAQLTLSPWLDGAELTGRFEAEVTQICSVTLDPFNQTLSGEIHVTMVPAGSPNAPGEEGPEVELDPDDPDPPDILEGERVDLSSYLVEHLALEIDPFPRKPGAKFDYVPDRAEESPFSVLRKLQDPKSST